MVDPERTAISAGHGTIPFQWTALWPLIGATVAKEQISQAIDHARALLEPSTQPPPEALTAILEEAIQTWNKRNSKKTGLKLHQALKWLTGWAIYRESKENET